MAWHDSESVIFNEAIDQAWSKSFEIVEGGKILWTITKDELIALAGEPGRLVSAYCEDDGGMEDDWTIFFAADKNNREPWNCHFSAPDERKIAQIIEEREIQLSTPPAKSSSNALRM